MSKPWQSKEFELLEGKSTFYFNFDFSQNKIYFYWFIYILVFDIHHPRSFGRKNDLIIWIYDLKAMHHYGYLDNDYDGIVPSNQIDNWFLM